MRIGMTANPTSLATVREDVLTAERLGLDSVWVAQLFGIDTLTALAALGDTGGAIELGTGVVPTYPRHPMMLASQALTVQEATGNRLALGIGLSHQMVIENFFGLSFEKPARHMREYLSVLMPLLTSGAVDFKGDTIRAQSPQKIAIDGAQTPPVLVAALAPQMLKLAGEMCDGTVTWMCGRRTLGDHIVPSITKAADAAARPAPRIVASLPVCVTDDPDGARELAAKVFSIYGFLPSYRAMLDREGAAGPPDIAIVGDEDTVRSQLGSFADEGVTELSATIFGRGDELERTRTVVASLKD